MEPIIYHRRRRVRPRGGSQYYRDRSERHAASYCGAPVTQWDADWRSRMDGWTGADGTEHVPCEYCKACRAVTVAQVRDLEAKLLLQHGERLSALPVSFVPDATTAEAPPNAVQ